MSSVRPLSLIAHFQKHYDELLRYLTRRTGDPERASDVAQETFLKLTHVDDAAVDVANPRAYIYRVAGNLVIDAQRRAYRTAWLNTDHAFPEAIADPVPSPEQAAVDRDALRQLDRALSELPPNARLALLLFRIDGLSHAQIAHRLGVSPSMVAKYLAQALKHCRDRVWATE